mgnify:CR=1 FL=1
MNKHLVLLSITAGLLLTACASESDDMNSTNYRNPLPECPDTPNCIRYSFASDEGATVVLDALESALERMKAYEIDRESGSIDAVFRIPFFGWKDDVNIRLETAGSGETLIHIRSASRVGYSDLGVNRMRIKKLRSEYYRSLKSLNAN